MRGNGLELNLPLLLAENHKNKKPFGETYIEVSEGLMGKGNTNSLQQKEDSAKQKRKTLSKV